MAAMKTVAPIVFGAENPSQNPVCVNRADPKVDTAIFRISMISLSTFFIFIIFRLLFIQEQLNLFRSYIQRI